MKTAMILAAGRGERLKPITNAIPKAMCLVHGLPLIEHHVTNLAKEKFERVVINHAHLGDQIRRHLGDGKKWGVEILYSPEPPGGLETGGGIYNALPLLGKEPFLTVNADIYTDFKFSTLQIPDNSLVHLILGDDSIHRTKRDFGLTELHKLTDEPNHSYLGIAGYHPQLFQNLKIGRYSIVPTLRKLITQQQISGELFSGLWIDIGTTARLEFANRK